MLLFIKQRHRKNYDYLELGTKVRRSYRTFKRLYGSFRTEMTTFTGHFRCCIWAVVSFWTCVGMGHTRTFEDLWTITNCYFNGCEERTVPIDAAHPHTFAEWLTNSSPWWWLHKDVFILLAIGSKMAWNDTCTQFWAEEPYEKSILKGYIEFMPQYLMLAIMESLYRSKILRYWILVVTWSQSGSNWLKLLQELESIYNFFN